MVMFDLLSCPYMVNNNNKKTHSSSKPRTAHMMVLSLVALTGLDKFCITSA